MLSFIDTYPATYPVPGPKTGSVGADLRFGKERWEKALLIIKGQITSSQGCGNRSYMIQTFIVSPVLFAAAGGSRASSVESH